MSNVIKITIPKEHIEKAADNIVARLPKAPERPSDRHPEMSEAGREIFDFAVGLAKVHHERF